MSCFSTTPSITSENDSFHFNSSRRHAYRNPGKTQTRILWANTPPTF